ncbi:MAG: YihY/virulence factor BrkB family protein [Phycisphaerae bacterium]
MTTRADQLTGWQYVLRFAIELFRHGAARLQQDRASVMAAALAFRTIFGLVPCIIIAMLIFRSFGGTEVFGEFVQEMLVAAHLDDVPGPKGSEETLGAWLQDRISSVSTQLNTRTIGLIGAVVLAWSVISLVSAIERCFNVVCQAPEHRPLLRRIPMYWTSVTLGPALLSLSFHFQSRFVAIVQTIGISDSGAALIGTVSSFVAAWLMLLVLYTLLPNTKVNLGAAVGGSLVAAVLWTIVTSAFGAYVSWSFDQENSAFAIIYSTLGLIPLFLLWVYVLWLIVIYGLEITNMLQVVGGWLGKPIRMRSDMPPLTDPAGIIPAMRVVRDRFEHGQSTDAETIVEETGLNPRAVEAMISGLCEANILHVVGENESTLYVPARPPEKITTGELLDVAVSLSDSSTAQDAGHWAWVRTFRDAVRDLPIHRPLTEL